MTAKFAAAYNVDAATLAGRRRGPLHRDLPPLADRRQPPGTLINVTLNHTIVWCQDKEASADI